MILLAFDSMLEADDGVAESCAGVVKGAEVTGPVIVRVVVVYAVSFSTSVSCVLLAR